MEQYQKLLLAPILKLKIVKIILNSKLWLTTSASREGYAP